MRSWRCGGQADVHGFHLRIRDCIFRPRVFSYGGEIQLLAGAAEIALHAAEVAREALRIAAGDRYHFRAGYLPPGFNVRAAHEAQTENRDFHANGNSIIDGGRFQWAVRRSDTIRLHQATS